MVNTKPGVVPFERRRIPPDRVQKSQAKRVQFKGGPPVARLRRCDNDNNRAPLSGSCEDILVDGIHMQNEVLAVRKDSLPIFGWKTADAIRAGFFSEPMQYGRVFHSSEFENHPNVTLFSDGQYQICVLDSRIGEEITTVIKTRELPTNSRNSESRYQGPKLIANLYLVSVDNDELPVYFYWDKPPVDAPLPQWKVVANYIDATFATKARESAEALAKDVNQELRKIPDIRPDSQDWINAEERFRRFFNDAKKNKTSQRFDEIIKANFTEEQQILLEVDFDNQSRRRKLQDRNTLIYRELMQTVFVNKNSNAVTKCTMVHFGLPVEPLTITNIRNAGSDEADPDDVLDLFGQESEHIIMRHWPLEFLDEYDDRGYGYPVLRRAKSSQPYKIDPSDPLVKRAREKRANVRPSESNSRSPQRICGAPVLDKSSAIRTATIGGYVPHIRGGAGKLPDEDSETFNLETSSGTYFFKDQPSDGKSLSAARDEFVLILQKAYPGEALDEMQFILHPSKSEVLLKNDMSQKYYNDKIRKPIREKKVTDAAVWLRKNKNKDNWHEPRDTVLLKIESVGETFWRLPCLASNLQTIKHYELGFRTAMEYLEPNHSSAAIKWTVGGESGYLSLAGEVPSSALCNSVIKAMRARRDEGKFETVTIELLEPVLDNPPRILLMPGVLEVKVCPRAGSAAMKTIRDFVHERCGKPTPIRLWKNVLHYSSGNMTALKVLPIDSKDDEQYFSDADLFLESVLICRPEFEEFTIFMDDKYSSDAAPAVRWRSRDWALESFREAVSELLGPNQNELTIWGMQSKETFQISNLMTEEQWRLDVFDRLEDNNITIEAGIRNGLFGEKESSGRQPVPYRPTATIKERGVAQGPQSGAQPAKGGEIQNPLSLTVGDGNDTSQNAVDPWDKYMMEQHKQDITKRDAYFNNQSVHNEKGEPSVPLYGPAREQMIQSGPSFPVVFSNMLTPSAVSSMIEDNLRLENIIIARQERCLICKENFEVGEHYIPVIRAHMEVHRRAIEECPSCHINGWSKLTVREKAKHLRECIKTFAGPPSGTSDEIQRQGLQHGNQRSQDHQAHEHFCLFCGRDLNDFETEEELLHHLLKDPGCESNDTLADSFCGYCGLDLRSSAATPTHRFGCKHSLPARRAIGSQSSQSTDSAKICQYPGCSTALNGMTDNEIRRHFAKHVSDESSVGGLSAAPGGLIQDDIKQQLPHLSDDRSDLPNSAQTEPILEVPADLKGKDELAKKIPERWKSHVNVPKENVHCPICLQKVNKAVLTTHRRLTGCNVRDDKKWIVCNHNELRDIRKEKGKGGDDYKTMGTTIAKHKAAWRAANAAAAAAEDAADRKAGANNGNDSGEQKKRTDKSMPPNTLKEPRQEKTPEAAEIVNEETAPTSDVVQRIKDRRAKEKAGSGAATKAIEAMEAAKKGAAEEAVQKPKAGEAAKKAGAGAAKKAKADEAAKKKAAAETDKKAKEAQDAATKKKAAEEAATATGQKRGGDQAAGPAAKKPRRK